MISTKAKKVKTIRGGLSYLPWQDDKPDNMRELSRDKDQSTIYTPKQVRVVVLPEAEYKRQRGEWKKVCFDVECLKKGRGIPKPQSYYDGVNDALEIVRRHEKEAAK